MTGALCDLVFFILLVSNRKILIITTFQDEQFFVMVAIGHGARATISGHQVYYFWAPGQLSYMVQKVSFFSYLLHLASFLLHKRTPHHVKLLCLHDSIVLK